MGLWTDSQLSGKNTLDDLPTKVSPDKPERFSGGEGQPVTGTDVQLAGSERRTASKGKSPKGFLGAFFLFLGRDFVGLWGQMTDKRLECWNGSRPQGCRRAGLE